MACYSDFDCRYGSECTIPAGSFSAKGVCIAKDQNDLSIPRESKHKIKGCQHDLQCGIGGKCFKQVGDIEGICL